jgi:polyisoprenoid-binding protein YceI
MAIRMAAMTMAMAAGKAAAQAVPDMPLTSGKLSFDANATLGAFTGVTTTVAGKLLGAATLAGVHGWVEAPSKSLNTGNDHRDRDMAGSLEIEKYPVIRFDLDSVAAGEARGDSIAVILKGRFTLHGQARAADVPGYVWLTPASARFHGAIVINVKDYGVGGLSKMLGLLKMNERITVRMDVKFGEP